MKTVSAKLLVFVLVMAFVAVAGWFGRKAYKGMTEAKLVQQAKQCVADKDWRNASLCLQRALQLNPDGVETSKLMADLMEAAGSPTALGWRMRVAQLEPESAERRFEWAKTALRMRDFEAARDALSGVDEKSRASGNYHKLMGALEWALGHPAEAEKHYLESLRLEPDDKAAHINLSTLRLNSTNATVAGQARESLQRMATNPAVRVIALDHLKTDALARKDFDEALAYSTELISGSNTLTGDRIEHLQLLRKCKSPRHDSYLAALKAESAESPTTAYALGRWMTVTEGPTNTLPWLQSLPGMVRTNEPIPQLVADCLILVKDWQGLLAQVDKADWGETEYYRLALVSMAHRSLGQELPADHAWLKALRLSSRRLDRLKRLAQIAASGDRTQEQTRVLREIVATFPKEKWAVDTLLAQLYANGDTRGIHLLLASAHETNPGDPMLKNNLAYVCLLLKTNLEEAHRMAKDAYEKAPKDPSVTSTYAYSLFLQGKQTEALSVLKELKPETLKSPTIAACVAIINAKGGAAAAAKESLTLAESATLLPEEKEMVRQARASL